MVLVAEKLPTRAERARREVRKTVLVVDDDESTRELLVATIERGPYRVLSAEGGEEAILAARAHRPELVLLDAEMPRLHGFEVCRCLKSDPETRGTTVIMLTALAQEHDRAAGMAAGADGYITKPFSPRDLLEQLDRALGG